MADSNCLSAIQRSKALCKLRHSQYTKRCSVDIIPISNIACLVHPSANTPPSSKTINFILFVFFAILGDRRFSGTPARAFPFEEKNQKKKKKTSPAEAGLYGLFKYLSACAHTTQWRQQEAEERSAPGTLKPRVIEASMRFRSAAR